MQCNLFEVRPGWIGRKQCGVHVCTDLLSAAWKWAVTSSANQYWLVLYMAAFWFPVEARRFEPFISLEFVTFSERGETVGTWSCTFIRHPPTPLEFCDVVLESRGRLCSVEGSASVSRFECWVYRKLQQSRPVFIRTVLGGVLWGMGLMCVLNREGSERNNTCLHFHSALTYTERSIFDDILYWDLLINVGFRQNFVILSVIVESKHGNLVKNIWTFSSSWSVFFITSCHVKELKKTNRNVTDDCRSLGRSALLWQDVPPQNK